MKRKENILIVSLIADPLGLRSEDIWMAEGVVLRVWQNRDGDPPIQIYQVLPVTQQEMTMKLNVGFDALLDHFESRYPDPSPLLDPARRCSVD